MTNDLSQVTNSHAAPYGHRAILKVGTPPTRGLLAVGAILSPSAIPMG